jgi:hypothetical protein
MKYPNSAELLVLIAKTKFRPFDKYDYMAFSGVESDNPLIAETDEYTIVIDGHIVNMLYSEDEFGGQLYSLIEGL